MKKLILEWKKRRGRWKELLAVYAKASSYAIHR